MGIYDNEGKLYRHTLCNNQFQQQKLDDMCKCFSKTYQDYWEDFIDHFFAEYLSVISGRISYYEAMRLSAQKLLDDYLRLREIKKLVPSSYTKEQGERF